MNDRTRSRSSLSLLILVAGLSAGRLPAETIYTYVSTPDDFIGRGCSDTITDDDGLWRGGQNDFYNTASVFFNRTTGLGFCGPSETPDESWTLLFRPASGELVPGVYNDAQRIFFQDPGRPGMGVTSTGRSCNSVDGDFEIYAVEFDYFGNLIRLDVTFEQHCGGVADPPRPLNGDLDFTVDGTLGPTSFTPGNILVSLEDRVFEYQPDGTLVQMIPIRRVGGQPTTPPSGSGDYTRDLILDRDGALHIFNGSSSAVLSSFEPASGSWRHDVFDGWSVSNTSNIGGIAAYDRFVFVPDINLSGDGFGVVRFDTSDNYSAVRFGSLSYDEVTIGLNGLLYALEDFSQTIHIFDPVTMVQLDTTVLDTFVSGIAVNAVGEIFGAGASGLDGVLYRFSPAGSQMDSLVTGERGLHDLDLTRDGQIVAGGEHPTLKKARVVVTTEALDSFTEFVLTDDEDNFPESYVAWVQLPPDPVQAAGGFESGDTSSWSGVVGELAGFLEVTAGAASEGAFGLEVTVGGICTEPDDRTISAPPPTISGDFRACNTITASGVEVVSPGAVFAAGQTIILGPNFGVAAGASFSAALETAFQTGLAYVQHDAAGPLAAYNARFDLNLDSLTIASGERIEHFAGYDGSGSPVFRLFLERNAADTGNQLVLAARRNDGTYAETSAGQEEPLVAGWNRIELAWRSTAGGGFLQVSVNDMPIVGLTGLVNDQRRVELARWGALGGGGSTSGSMLQDSFVSWQ